MYGLPPSRKHWLRSKTLRFNLVIALLAAVEANFRLLESVMPVNVYPVLLFSITLVNVVLRFVTTAGVTLRNHNPPEAR